MRGNRHQLWLTLTTEVLLLYFALDSELDIQSRPSYRPSPVVAHVDWMYQLRWRSECRPSLSVISAAFIAFGRSCLLAKTSRIACEEEEQGRQRGS